jgi:hypothetical protein
VFIVALIVTNGEDRNMTRTQNRFRDAGARHNNSCEWRATVGKLTGKLRHETSRATDQSRRLLLSTELTAVVAAVIAATASVTAVFLNQHGTIG